jgi:hypothetical protein
LGLNREEITGARENRMTRDFTMWPSPDIVMRMKRGYHAREMLTKLWWGNLKEIDI